MIQVLFLYIIRRRSRNSSQVFSEPQQLSQFAPVPKRKESSRKSSVIISQTIRKSVQQYRNSTIKVEGVEDNQSMGMNSNHYIKAIMKEQKLQRKKSIKIESPNSTILQVQFPQNKSQTENPESQRDPFQELIGDQKPQLEKLDIIIYVTYYVERIGFEQGLILLLWYLDVNFYIFIPISLFAGVVMRIQEKFGYRLIQKILLILIHGLLVLETYLIIANDYETFCYLIVLGIETVFSIISYILLKKCK
ncbi:unnamed protein product [Paramecium primaurelia]|uniref:Transmembrane protein n=2 Tax=Paramecium TaxID=5884 RepID=A0A8S1S2J5_9CILI|nr:unnamed protein product [Paramecium primaurelia]CAD8133134.1 unnamed protein product [Paramecium pentaurelia]